jgi:hypothetical protein
MTRPGKKPLSLVLCGAGLVMGLACTGTVGASRGGGKEPGATGGSEMTPGSGGGGGGSSGGTGGSGVVAPPPGVVDWAGPAVFRRLTLAELQNALRDLLGESMSLSTTDLTADAGTAVGFGVGAKFTNSVDALGFANVSDTVTDAAIKHVSTLVPASCNLMATATGEQESCVNAFIEKFGLRAFRRPLLAKEKSDLLALYRTLRGLDPTVTMADGIGGLIKGMIQSPQFLYHWELTEPAQKDGMLVRYGDYELASRLSFFLWDSIPDDKLFTAAAAGQLQDPNMLMAQARRMLTDGRAKDAVADFHTQWLEFGGLPGLSKDASYTKYNAAVGQAMIDETVAFAQSILLGPNATGKLSDLFTSTNTFVNGPLAALYGVSGVSGDKLMPAKANAQERAGILTQGAFLASHADGDFDHPVKRGVTVLRHVICQDVPPPPGNVDIPPLPERPQNVTTRQFFAQHSSHAPLCASCHNTIDPMGFAFENYDAVGQYRTTEAGKPVDATGSIEVGSSKLTFKDAVDLTTQLSKTPELRECMSRHWVRYLLRRQELKEEKTTIDALLKAFDDSKGDLREVLVAVTGTKAFTHRQPFVGEQTR